MNNGRFLSNEHFGKVVIVFFWQYLWDRRAKCVWFSMTRLFLSGECEFAVPVI